VNSKDQRVGINQMTVIVLSVHYKYPALLRDQWERIHRCIEPTRQLLNAELRYHPIVHGGSAADVVTAAHAVAERDRSFSSCIQLPSTPVSSASAHGDSLAEALLELSHQGLVQDEDLLVVMDHDAHPLDSGLFAVVGQKLLEQHSLAGVGIPQWHRGHCYLHPSFLVTRAELIRRIGPDLAFKAQPSGDDRPAWDVCEGLTVWCENNGRPILPLRVNATHFPWSRWDSDMVPNGGAEFVGEHGERVHFGNLMRYGLDGERSLVSHVWAAPLRRQSGLSRLKRWLLQRRSGGTLGGYDEQQVLSAYLAEPQPVGQGLSGASP
jgi:hypothetical protein